MGIDLPPPAAPSIVTHQVQTTTLSVESAELLALPAGDEGLLFREYKSMIMADAHRRAEEGVPGKIPLFKLPVFDDNPELLQYVKKQLDNMVTLLMKRTNPKNWAAGIDPNDIHAALAKQVIEMHDYLKPIIGDNNIRPVIGGMVRCSVDACKEALYERMPVPYPREVLHNIKKTAENSKLAIPR